MSAHGLRDLRECLPGRHFSCDIDLLWSHQCDPTQGHVAFSQPTSSGKAVMDRWGGGAVRVFIEDEQEDVE